MVPTYILRLTLQHRALYCYLVLSVWILILLSGMYKYVGLENESSTAKFQTTDLSTYYRKIHRIIESPKIIQKCNPYEDIVAGGEGCLNSNYSLEGVLILIRHGDRGPLVHVQNISNVDCVGPPSPLYQSFESHIKNITGSSALFQLFGPFHGTPPLPGSECRLGLLTKMGASQLLAIGHILHGVYFEDLKINSSLIRENVKAYSTKYRRTIQSALAFLYTFLTKENFHKLYLQETSSLAYCFEDCACDSVDYYSNKFSAETHRFIKSNPNLLKLVRSVSSIVFELHEQKISSDPHALKDAVLTYICHNSNFPCVEDKYIKRCVHLNDIYELFRYLEKEEKLLGKSRNLRKVCLLRAYGLLKNIVSQLLAIVSVKRPKVVLYSAHDKTLSYLATALGITSDGVFAPPYASRLIIEVFKTQELMTDKGPVGRDYFFRLLFNGKDVTKKVKFCKTVPNRFSGYGSPNVKRRKSPYFFLCPLENIVRFLHDDYFTPFNASNLKDACTVPS